MLDQLKTHLPIARPPWTGLGKRLESKIRKALYDFNLVDGVDHVGIALSGGKDSLTLLYFLHAISGKGFADFKLSAFHVSGEFSCGASVHESYLGGICKEMDIPLKIVRSTQKRETLECYSCSRERRRLIFDAAKAEGITTIAMGHHLDDSNETLLMNLFHKGEFAANLPLVPMHDYGVKIIRPLIYVFEEEIIEFAKMYNFARITCQCPVGQDSNRRRTKMLIKQIEHTFPNAKANLAHAAKHYGSDKAARC